VYSLYKIKGVKPKEQFLKSGYLLHNRKQMMLVSLLNSLEDKKYSRLKVFKIAFLLGRKIDFYDFIPYRYGPYSFEMDKDLRMFNNNGWINMQDKSIYINHDTLKALSIKAEYKEDIYGFISKFKNVNEKNLLDFIYKDYPYYSQNSLLVKQPKVKKNTAAISIYTIGYQNLSIDSFINTLIEKGINIVLDVRNKPLSYKYGFNYYWLNKYLPELDIKYINIPELGIEEKYRKILSQGQLWQHYSKSLELKKNYLNKACDILKKQPTVLMCYEMNPEHCHRLILAKRINELINLPIINFDVEKNQWIKLDY